MVRDSAAPAERVAPWADPRALTLVQAFVAVVAAGSFTKAGRRAGVDKSMLSRRVQELEASLGVRLLVRTTRRIRATDAGLALYESAGGPLEELARALGEAADQDRIHGRLIVATVPAMARQFLVPLLADMRAAYPEVFVEVRADERVVSLVDEGIDIALRVGRFEDSSLISRKLGSLRYVLVAAREWAETHPECTSPDRFDGHWVLYAKGARADQWRFERGRETMDVRVKPALRVDNAELLLEAVRGGLGVSPFLGFQVSEGLDSGELVRVAPKWRVATTIGVYAVRPHRSLMPRRAQIFLDEATERIKAAESAWNAQAE